MTTDNILDLFEGLSDAQAKELRRRIVPALQQVRAEILNPKGATKMADKEIDLNEILKNMDEEEFIERLTAPRPAKAAQQQAAADLDRQEQAEIAELASRHRGVQYTEGKRAIQAKFARRRAEAAELASIPANPDPKVGEQIAAEYDAEAQKLRRGDLPGRQVLRDRYRRKARAAGFAINFDKRQP